LDIESILGELANIHPSLVKEVWGTYTPYESICGFISDKITKWIIKNFPEMENKVMDVSGRYIGEGSRTGGTYHCWVEVRIPAGKIIIDGAYAQFFPDELPMEIRDRIRLAIFYPTDHRQAWYVKN